MRKSPLVKPEKAYKDLDFLSSPDARTIRILTEFLQPQSRFRKEKIRDTIVFFGSARLKPRKEALRLYKGIEKEMRHSGNPGAPLLKRHRDAELQVEMSRYYEDAVLIARRLTAWSKSLPEPNRFVICSGGGPGVMEAANRGAFLAKGKSLGLNISLPFEQFANPYISEGLAFEFHYFFMRKFWFAYLAKALAIMPGGFGTLDELMEMLTLLQTKKIKKKVAVVIYGREYWQKVLNFNEMLKAGLISRADLSLFKFIDSPDEAFEYLRAFLVREYPPVAKRRDGEAGADFGRAKTNGSNAL
jgi:uncharacterized protein (TIGR00730 family)